jgi:hypothetical protein
MDRAKAFAERAKRRDPQRKPKNPRIATTTTTNPIK